MTLASDRVEVHSEPQNKPRGMKTGTAILIGAGPAGLAAALELERRSAVRPIVTAPTPRKIFLARRNGLHPGNRPHLWYRADRRGLR